MKILSNHIKLLLFIICISTSAVADMSQYDFFQRFSAILENSLLSGVIQTWKAPHFNRISWPGVLNNLKLQYQPLVTTIIGANQQVVVNLVRNPYVITKLLNELAGTTDLRINEASDEYKFLAKYLEEIALRTHLFYTTGALASASWGQVSPGGDDYAYGLIPVGARTLSRHLANTLAQMIYMPNPGNTGPEIEAFKNWINSIQVNPKSSCIVSYSSEN